MKGRKKGSPVAIGLTVSSGVSDAQTDIRHANASPQGDELHGKLRNAASRQVMI
jgi:hypothetical protein